MTTRVRAAFLLVSVLACGEPPSTGTEPEAPAGDERRTRAERAARIAREILEHPDAGRRVLQDHDMSPDQFSDVMYEIAGDPELAEVYETVRG